jgi:hypothetical protein
MLFAIYNHDIEQISKNRTDLAELKRQLIEVIWKLYTSEVSNNNSLLQRGCIVSFSRIYEKNSSGEDDKTARCMLGGACESLWRTLKCET